MAADSLRLLEQWQGEHERNDLELCQLARQKDALTSRLRDVRQQTQNVVAEIAGIKKRGLEGAGSVRRLTQVIDQEEVEGRMLSAEIERLTQETQKATAALEQEQQRATTEALGLAAALPERRAQHRKRCDEGFANAKRLATSLRVLEREVEQCD